MTDTIETDRRVMSTDPKAVVREFATICAATQMAHTLYRHLFERDQHRLRLYDEIAPLTFHDLSDIVGQHVLLQFAKLTDSAKTGRYFNLTSNYIIEMLPWPDEVRERLAAVNARLMAFGHTSKRAGASGSRMRT